MLYEESAPCFNKPALSDEQISAKMGAIKKVLTHCQEALTWAQQMQAEHVNTHRRPAPDLKAGDWVTLDARFIH
jgi:hypothetical protein